MTPSARTAVLRVPVCSPKTHTPACKHETMRTSLKKKKKKKKCRRYYSVRHCDAHYFILNLVKSLSSQCCAFTNETY